MANDAINTTCDQRVPRLNGCQAAKSIAKHKDRPDAKRTTDSEENNAQPSNGIPVERPEPNSVGVGRQITRKQPDKCEGTNDPAVGTILAYSRAQVSAAKARPSQGPLVRDRQASRLR